MEAIEPVDLLAFGPHPDDVELWAGGWMTKLAAAGRRLVIVDLTRGEAGTRGTPASRAAERDAATARLALAGREDLGLPDTGLVVTPDQTEPLVAAIRRWRPRVVLGPDAVDLHPDHVAAAGLVERAYYLATIAHAPGGGLPPHRPDALLSYLGQKERTPSFVVDVSDVWEERVELAKCYATQLGVDGSGPQTNLAQGFLRRLEIRAAYWGAKIGAAYGEPYRTDRVLAVDDPIDTFRKRGGLVL